MTTDLPQRRLADMPATLGPETPGQPGRPTLYTEEIAAEIVSRLAGGESLRQVCRDPLMPAESTVRLWAVDNRDGFSARYARAREAGWHAMAEEALEIADDGTNDWQQRELEGGRIVDVPDHEHVQRSRLRVDTRKWLLAKMLPAIFGERVNVDVTRRGPQDMTDDELAAIASGRGGGAAAAKGGAA